MPSLDRGWLEQYKEQKTLLRVRLLSGTDAVGRVTEYDADCIELERRGGGKVLVYRHAIATLEDGEPDQGVAS